MRILHPSVAGLAGAVVVILALSLFFAASVASHMAPKPPLEATGPSTACTRDSDCRCNAFDGAEFIEGQFTQGVCGSNKMCMLCVYE
ncbi:MAG TPA: hypothetical protein PKV72_02455 [Candidatus Peribacteria bacterium]|nr:hypothetical protein [Candidatus Peribacteria bacterium]